jgi:hypothetical protein
MASASYSYNEYSAKRVAVGQFALGNTAATTLGTGVIIPAGAIVTNIRFMCVSAATTTGASATLGLSVSSTPLMATINLSTLSALTVCGSVAPVVAAGVYIPASAELQVLIASSATSTAAGTYNVYVDYIYVS